MKTINSLILSLAALFVLGACEEDGDKYYLSSLTSNELIASTDNIVLTEATAQKNVLSLAWTDRTLAISNPNFKPTNLLKTAMQVSLSEDFSGTIVESAETSLSKTYNGAELNIVANNLGVEANVAAKFYFRLKGTTGNNIDPAYSNVEAVTITPYELDMRFANVLDQNATATGMTLFSANTDGIYKGFVGVEAGSTSWCRKPTVPSGEMTTRPECRSCSLQPATGSAGSPELPVATISHLIPTASNGTDC